MGAARTLPGNQCTVHGYHWPEPKRTVRHHIWPKEWGGPDVSSNLVNVCDTGHYNIHTYMDAAIYNRELPKVTRNERKLAEQGIAGYMKNKES